MSGKREPNSVASKSEDEQGSFHEELCHSRMEVQWLKWEKERLAAELEATRRKIQQKGTDEVYLKSRDNPQCEADSEVLFKLPEDTSGYASWKAQQVSSVGMSPVRYPKRERRLPARYRL